MWANYAAIFLLGLAIGWLIKSFLRDDAALGEAKTAYETVVSELRIQLKEKNDQIEKLQERLATGKNLEEQKILLHEASQKLTDTFKALSSEALNSNNQRFVELAQQTLEGFSTKFTGNINLQGETMGRLMDPLKESLRRYQDIAQAQEKDRQEAYGALRRDLASVNEGQLKLRDETKNLADALSKPQVKGRWGEIALRRIVEVSGLSAHCDFEEQVSLNTEDGRLRPDLIIKLPGNKTVIVDAKVPSKAYLDAVEAKNETERDNCFRQHRDAVRGHMASLSGKAYWAQFTSTPDFVVLFLPMESMFSAALEQDRDLIIDGIAAKVILATPTTLIALLRTVAYGWQQQRMQENSEKIAKAGTELFERFCKFASHLEKVRKNLEDATHCFNDAIGSFESRLLPSARKLKELGVVAADKEIPETRTIDAQPRQINQLAAETEGLAD